MRMLLSSSVLIAHVAALAACSSSTPTQPERPPPQEVQPSISDAAHGGTEHFYFLPPLIAAPEYEGIFDPTRSPTVEICTLGTAGCEPVIAEFTKQTGPGSETVRVDTAAEHYIVNWHTREFALVDGQIYRIRVLLEGQEAGHADVVAVSSGKELKNASTGDVIALKDGRTLPIKFRIEEGLDMTARVPAVTPDGVPESVYDSSTRGPHGFILDLVLVVFKEGSSQAERQAAIDSIDGTVVGGKRLYGDAGYYFVRIEDDGSIGPLFEALDLLRSLPQVDFAGPEVVGNFSMYRRPVDGPGFEEDDWSLKPANASNENWALERIAGPLAWGCSVGTALAGGVQRAGRRLRRDRGRGNCRRTSRYLPTAPDGWMRCSSHHPC